MLHYLLPLLENCSGWNRGGVVVGGVSPPARGVDSRLVRALSFLWPAKRTKRRTFGRAHSSELSPVECAQYAPAFVGRSSPPDSNAPGPVPGRGAEQFFFWGADSR